jgi:hypothetical protein
MIYDDALGQTRGKTIWGRHLMNEKRAIFDGVAMVGTDESMLSEDGDLILSGFASGTPSVSLLHAPMQKYASLFRKLSPRAFTYVNLTPEPSAIDMSLFRNVDQLSQLSTQTVSPHDFVLGRNLSEFVGLREASIRGTTSAKLPDIDQFPNLVKLTTDFAKTSASKWIKSKKLIDLTVYGLRADDVSLFRELTAVRRLCLVDGSLQSLSGLGEIPSLETLHCVRTRRLEDLIALNKAKRLVNIKFESFRKVKEWSFLAQSTKWRSISVEIANSIEFIERLPHLTFFYCGEVLDGDTSFVSNNATLAQAENESAQLQRLGTPRNIPFYERLF